MRLIIKESYEEMARVTCQHLLGVMFSKQNRVNLALTTGRTPHEVFRQLVPEVKGKKYLEHVHYYNFEVMPHKIKPGEGIAITVLRERFLTPAEIPEERFHKLDETNYMNQDKRIIDEGGLDAILLGIGEDGHFSLNFPNTTKFKDYTSNVPCDDRIKSLISSAFDDKDDIPDFYITMGPRSIMSANQLILMANGKHKASIIKRLLENNISADLPSSILTMHPNLTVILDAEAASLL